MGRRGPLATLQPAQQYWYHRNLSLLGRAVWLGTIAVVVLSTEALLGQGVSETGSAAGRKAVNEPMEEVFISWVYREGGDKARKTLQSEMVTWAFLLAEM